MSEWIITNRAYNTQNHTVLLVIAHYGSGNRKYFLECLKEYNSYNGYSITAHLLLTEDIDCSEFSNLNIIKHIYPLSIRYNLTYEYKPIFYYEMGKFDYYVYTEDDNFITQQNFDAFISTQATLPFPYVCGFLRYEYKENDDYKYLFEAHPVHSCHRGGTTVIKANYIINDEPYFEVYNIHQSSHILTKVMMDYLRANHAHYFERICHYVGIAEGAASDVYYDCGLTKVIPRNRASEFIIHHMIDKYVRMWPNVYTKDTTPDDIKMATLQTDLKPIIVYSQPK